MFLSDNRKNSTRRRIPLFKNSVSKSYIASESLGYGIYKHMNSLLSSRVLRLTSTHAFNMVSEREYCRHQSGSYVQPCVEGESRVSPAITLRESFSKSHITNGPLGYVVYKHTSLFSFQVRF